MSLKALTTLQHFIGSSQRHAVITAMRGEEGAWFAIKLNELARIVETMPKTTETDGQDDAAIAYLHYFAGGHSWYITEKDMGCDTDPEAERGRQRQAFGLADLWHDGGELGYLGYISIAEILANGGELDFHWTPKTLGEIRRKAMTA